MSNAAVPAVAAEEGGDSQDDVAVGDDLRQRGNFEFSQKRFDTAAQLYSQALDHCGGDTTATALNLCNRSASYYQMQEYEQAKDDALRAYEMTKAALAADEATTAGDDDDAHRKQKQSKIEHARLKAAFRLAKTHVALREYEQAKKVIKDGIQLIKDVETSAAAASGKDADEQQHHPSLSEQRQAFEDLWKQVLKSAYEEEKGPEQSVAEETTITTVQRPVSIKEFEKGREIGYGNFSEIVVVTHKRTKEKFALKIIEKKKAADLAKRQHPNVYNEIHMERRVLLERLPRHRFVIQLYHAFQDYNSLFYLMELHEDWNDLWTELKYFSPSETTKTAVVDDGTGTAAGFTAATAATVPASAPRKQYYMIGCHRSQAVVWMAQLLDAMEHMHLHGVRKESEML